MKRDMDLIRQITLATSDLDGDMPLNELPEVDDLTFAQHVQWMEEAGLVHAAISPKDSPRPARKAMVFRLTWQGCEFADAVRSDTMWSKAKTNVLKPTMSFTFETLKDWLKAEITQGFPTIKSLGN